MNSEVLARLNWRRFYCKTSLGTKYTRLISRFSIPLLRAQGRRSSPSVNCTRRVGSITRQASMLDLLEVPTAQDYPDLPNKLFSRPCSPTTWGLLGYEGRIKIIGSICHHEPADWVWRGSQRRTYQNCQKYFTTKVGQIKSAGTAAAGSKLPVIPHSDEVQKEFVIGSRKVRETTSLAVEGGQSLQSGQENKHAETKKGDFQVKIDVYNYAASILTVPRFKVSLLETKLKSLPSYTVTIELLERNIHVQASGSLKMAEIEACLKFNKAFKQSQNYAKDGTPNTNAGLNVLTAAEFIWYYQRSQKEEHKFIVETGQPRNLKYRDGRAVTKQVCLNSKEIGDRVFSKYGTVAEKLAYLTAAVELAKEQREIFNTFLRAERGISGKILGQHRPHSFEVAEKLLHLMSNASKPINETHGLVRIKAGELPSNMNVLNFERSFRTGLTSQQTLHRNEHLLKWHSVLQTDPFFQKLRDQREKLPINQFRLQVLELVNKNPYSIIIGETGSGKTTQLPQIILEDAIITGEASAVDIICTQPRRIAAKSVAARVAEERGERLGGAVGYQVRLDKKLPKEGGSITYCSTGILLKQLQNIPDRVMNAVSHIIIDEAHERDIPIDFLMMTLKKLLEARAKEHKKVPKVVIMSATLNTADFANYFGQTDNNGVRRECPSITVPGRTFPVENIYLQQFMTELSNKYPDLKFSNDTLKYLEVEKNFNQMNKTFSELNTDREMLPEVEQRKDYSFVPHDLVAATIAHIITSTSEGAILVFLPGLTDIIEVQRRLSNNPLGHDLSSTPYKIHILHSTLREAQAEVFAPASGGIRKIILATNIAETSVTIPEIHHVIDSGKVKIKVSDIQNGIIWTSPTWISKSNSKQRAGRAGRVQNGHYYALFSESRFESLQSTGLPEMLRSDLQEVCLQAKGQSMQCSIKEFLSTAMEPPTPESIDTSIQSLKNLGALTNDEEITPLGRLLNSMPLHPALGKLIVLGIIFRCFDPILILAAACSEPSIFLFPVGYRKQADRNVKLNSRGSNSDIIATINAFRRARQIHLNNPRHMLQNHMYKELLSYNVYMSILQTMIQIESVLCEAGIIPKTDVNDRSSLERGHPAFNENSGNEDLVKALYLAAANGDGIAARLGKGRSFRSRKDTGLIIHPSSVNFSEDPSETYLPKDALLCYGSIHGFGPSQFAMKNTSLISPMVAVLFSRQIERVPYKKQLKIDGWLHLKIMSRLGGAIDTILQMRTALDNMLSKAFSDISKRQHLTSDPLRRQFIRDITNVLNSAGETSIISEITGPNPDIVGSRPWTNYSPPSSNPSSKSVQQPRNSKKMDYNSLLPFISELLSDIDPGRK